MLVSLHGGLGNQLFKFFAALNYKIANNLTELVLDVSWYSKFSESSTSSFRRDFHLDRFPNFAELARLKDSKSLIFSLLSRKAFSGQWPWNDLLITETSFRNPSRLHRRFMVGNFESIEYLPSRGLMSFALENPKISERAKTLISDLTELKKTSTPIAIHIRRGDYLRFSEFYDCVDISYYINAMRLLTKESQDVKTFLFADDEVEARRFFGNQFRFDVIVSRLGLDTFDEWVLLSHFAKVICANSTFSWWASLYGMIEARTEIAIIPRKFNSFDEKREYSKGFEGFQFLSLENSTS